MASRWVRSMSAAISTLFLASTIMPFTANAADNRRGDRNHNIRAGMEVSQVRDNNNNRRGNDRRDHNWRGNSRDNDRRDNNRRNSNWRGNNRDNDWNRNNHNRHNHLKPRYDRYDYRNHNNWRHRNWSWNAHVHVYKPPRRVYAPRYYYKSHVDPWDVIVWGVLPLIVYQSLTISARESHQYAYNQAMAAPVGETVIWNDSNYKGTVRTTRDGWSNDRYCREFQQTITIGGREENGWGIACQEPDGSWRLVPQS